MGPCRTTCGDRVIAVQQAKSVAPVPQAPMWWQHLAAEMAHTVSRPTGIADGNLCIDADAYPRALVHAVEEGGQRSQRERIAVYHRQYWLRLIEVLQSELPLTMHRLGTQAFNATAMAYLIRYPPYHAELHRLSAHFPAWVAKHADPDIAEAARLDVLMARLFVAPRPVSAHNVGTLCAPLRCWRERWNSIADRHQVSMGHTPVPMPGTGARHYAIWRAEDGLIRWISIDPDQSRLLRFLQHGEDLDATCARLTRSLDPAALERVTAGITGWFTTWSRLGWMKPL